MLSLKPHHNARYAKLRRQINLWNRDRFQRNFQLQILETRSLAFIVEEYARVIDLTPILINEIRIPLRLDAYRGAEVRTDYVPLCRQERLRDVHNASRGLSWTAARFLYDNVTFTQLPLCKRILRDKSFRDGRIVMRFNRHNVSRPNAISRLRRIRTLRFGSPISADKFSNSVIQSFHSNRP